MDKSTGFQTNGFNININVAEESFSMDTPIAIGLLTNELITNTIKHAKTDGRQKEIFQIPRKAGHLGE